MRFTFFKGFYSGMKLFGASVVNVTNFILLFPVYIVGIGLTSVISKLFKTHFLNLKKIDKKAKSYWEDRTVEDKDLEKYYRQF